MWQNEPVDCRAGGKQHHHTGPVVLMDGDVGEEEGGGTGHALKVQLEGVMNELDVQGYLQ